MKSFVEKWADTVISGRLLIIVFVAILIPMALLTGKAIPFDNTTDRYFVDGDPTLLDFEVLRDLFGDTEYIIVGIEANPGSRDVFEIETLRAIATLTDFFDYHEYVTQVRSISNYQYTHADGDDLSTDDLIEDIDELDANPEKLEQVRSIMAAEKLALGSLITEDFKHARISARVEYRADTAEHKIQLVEDLFNLIEDENLGTGNYTIHLSGQPFLNERFEKIAEKDVSVLIPVMAALMLVMLYLNFRSIVVTLMPWVVIGCGILVVTEIQSYLGLPHSTIDQALNPTLIIIGIGVSVHVLVEFFNFLGSGNNSKQAARTTIIHLWKPAFFTALTTSCGFYALSVTKIMPVKDFALLGAIGPMVLFLFALTLLPAMLSYLPKAPAKTEEIMDRGLISNLVSKIPTFTRKYRYGIVIAGGAIFLLSLAALPTIKIDTNFVQLFKESSVVRQDIGYFDEVFDGVMTMDIILDSGSVDGIKDPEFLAQLESFQAWLESREPIGAVNSLADYLKEISQALNSDDPAYYRLPTSREMTAQFLLLYESSGANEDLSDLKDFDDRYARLTMTMTNLPASEAAVEIATIKEKLNTDYDQLNPLLTGGMVLFTAQDVYTVEGMTLSFLTALVVIAIIFIVIFKSFKYGLLSLIPSIVPILITGGVAGLTGVYLDMSTTIVGAMTMGIAVDDAIHVMNRYMTAKKEGATTHEAITRAMNESGRAVVFSSIVLVLGFSVLGFASFVPIILIGVFGAIIMYLALLGDLLFLPAILYLIDDKD